MLQTYFKNTSKRMKKISLALKGFIGTLATAAYFQDNKDAAFWFLVSGAFIDFLIECTSDDDGERRKRRNRVIKTAAVLFLIMFLFSGCKMGLK